MHKKLPIFYIFVDKYNREIFKNKNLNIGVIYRNYNDNNRLIELIKIAKACKRNRYQLFVSNDIKLALKVKANGIYIPSFNKTFKHIKKENKNLLILGSAHNQWEINEKMRQNCSGIFLSPVFQIKKKREFLNLYKFNLLANYNNTNIFALGGINENNINKLRLLSIKGFGGISIFKKKTGLKKGRFFKV